MWANIRLEMTGERINELKDRLADIIQPKEQMGEKKTPRENNRALDTN